MTTRTKIIIVVVAVIVLGIVGYYFYSKKKTVAITELELTPNPEATLETIAAQ